MHELSIAMSILDALEEQSALHDGAAVASVHLRLGPLSGVLPQALQSAFELAREGTDFAACQLLIEETPIAIRCPICHKNRPVRSIQDMACVVCGSPSADIIGGRELEIRAMEIIQESRE
jgi:hydrogenase nickel incorporation protein HypA/HybF